MPALELDIKTSESDKGLKFTVQIVQQRLRGSAARFTASNGFYFSSLSCPAIGVGYNNTDSDAPPMMYLRGSCSNNDNDILYTTSVGYIEKLKAAVIEYNIDKEGI